MTPRGDGPDSAMGKAAALARRALARTAVSLALFAAGAALSLYWSSFLVPRLSHNFDSSLTPRALAGVVGGALPGTTPGQGTGLTLDTGPQASAVAGDLRIGAAGALVATALLLPAGLALTPNRRRRQVMARVGRWATITGGLLVSATWVVPGMVELLTSTGSAHHVAATVTSADAPGRIVALFVLAVGGAFLTLAHLRDRRQRGLVFPVTPAVHEAPVR
ncbi:MAG: hypothetical protein ACYDA2_04120 [Acidimicrobiales bacterium]